jgi:ATP-binding protein involved in chromosome partitioning
MLRLRRLFLLYRGVKAPAQRTEIKKHQATEQAHMAVITEELVLNALGGIVDPEEGNDIVSLGMVSGLQVKDGHVAFALEVDPERGPHMDPLRKEAEQIVHSLPGVISATVVLTAERAAPGGTGGTQQGPQGGHQHGPHDHGGHQHGGQQPGGQQGPQQAPQPGMDPGMLPGVRKIVAVASGKGGVGKSTTAVNLGLAAAGHKVGILDADVYGPSMPRMMGLSGQPTSNDGKTLDPMENYGVKCMSMGFLVEEETPMIWRGPMAGSALQQMMRDVNWGELDILIVDMPPGTGDIQLTLSQQVPLAGAVIVSTPQDIALLDARKGLNMFRKVDVPVLGIVENMSYFACPHCGERTDVFSHGGARAEAEKLGTDFLGEVPLAIEIRETSDGGSPIVVSQPASPHAEAYRAIAEKVWEKVVAAEGLPAGPKIVIQ